MAAWENVDREVGPIRVLIANLSGLMLQLLLDLIGQQADMQLTGQVQGTVEVLEAAGENVDVLVLGVDQLYPPPGICSHLLCEYPHLRILVIAATGEISTLYWLGRRQQQLRKLSSATLLSNIRRAHKLNPAI